MMFLLVFVLLSWTTNMAGGQPFDSFIDKGDNLVVQSKVTVITGHWIVPGKGSKHPLAYYQKW
jgi:hypothetical protein